MMTRFVECRDKAILKPVETLEKQTASLTSIHPISSTTLPCTKCNNRRGLLLCLRFFVTVLSTLSLLPNNIYSAASGVPEMGNDQNTGFSKTFDLSTEMKKPLPIETSFAFPSPLPSWPAGEGFASGSIDLGGLEISQVSKFTKVWAAHEGGPDNLGATFFEPASIPDGFFMLGSYTQPNNKPLSGWVLVGKDPTNDPSSGALKPPTDYTLVWSSETLKIKQGGVGYIWLPTAPDGYKAIGHVVTGSPDKPALDKIRCVRLDFVGGSENDEAWIWGMGEEVDPNGINVHGSRPRNRGVQALGIPTGTFVACKNGVNLDVPRLKNVDGDQKAMPNVDQITALVRAYSPVVYFHPDEEYFPSSVEWLFQNGALLYTRGDESRPVGIDPTGANLPQGGSDDDAYWIDLPIEKEERERVKRGDLSDARAYLHVKPVSGGTFTDIAVWLFYPFNGPARAKVEFFSVSLGKIGEHVGDWEHVTLRISNLDGQLKSVYFSQHSKGVWVDASELEYGNGSKPVVYSSLHGHGAYPRQGLVLQGHGKVGIRNDCGKGQLLDVGERYSVMSAEYLGSAYAEPPWLNYARKWGPKIEYSIEEELRKVEKVLPRVLRGKWEKLMGSLPDELVGEEGPVGPKGKDSWYGDERSRFFYVF